MAVVTVDDVRSVIHSFLEKITEEQWILLKEGTPDDATMYLLAEMITEFIISITNTILANLRSKDADVCKEELLNSLNETLHQSFVQALEFTEEMQSVSSESLTKLIAKEVAESVNSALSASTDSESRDFVVPHDKVGGLRVTPSRRLNTMVGHASAVLRDFMTKVKSLCPPQPRQSRSYRATDVENTDKEDMVPPMESPEHEDAEIEDLETSDEKMEEDEVERPDTGDRLESPVKSERQDTPEKMASEDSFLAQTSKAVQEIIRQELYELTEPVLHTVEESEYELLQSDFSLEIEVIGDDISQILTEEAKSLQHSETESPREENNLKSKIKTLFAKLFAKSLIHRMVAQLKSKYHKIFKGKGRHSTQSLRSNVESLLLDEYDITEGGNEVSVFRQLEIISSGKHLVFTKELSDLIYNHIKDGMVTPEIVPESERKKSIRKTLKEHYDALYNDVGNRVKCFLSLMNWWLKMKVGSYCNRVVLALKNTKIFSQMPPTEVTAEEDATRSEEDATRSEEDATRSEEDATRSEEDATRAKEDATRSEEDATRSEEDATRSEEDATRSEEDATRSEERDTESEEDAALKKRYIAVSVLVEKLVCRVLTKTKNTIMNAEALTRHIIKKTWAEVETLDFKVTEKSIKNIDKAIFKDLCKVWKSADMVVILMKSGDPLIEKYIAVSFKSHLTLKKPSTIHRFFSCVRRVLAEPFLRIFV
ncbi:enolase-phosphatase E1-like isoform X2 [Thunnus albacares]|uniref:enolase-phosphatase E1-like isoform X2 n=1 Tax=Thunnus albacares TaxID=8236 RepID=UPI001CF71CEC|nr:enolase-phosphatase E1-like isoform X2 [Thunnus albacares]